MTSSRHWPICLSKVSKYIWPAFIIFGLVRCIYIFVCDICWITREAGEKRRTAKERAAILLAYFLLQYILSWKPFAWDMICTKFLVHYFSLMFSIFAEEIFILEVNNPIYGLTNVIWISWIRSTFKYLQYIFLLSITFNTGQPWHISAAIYVIYYSNWRDTLQSHQKNGQILGPICEAFDIILQ